MQKSPLAFGLVAGTMLAGLAVILPASGVQSSDTATGTAGPASNPDAVWVAHRHGISKFATTDGQATSEDRK